jgi:hypothetical protein
MYATVIPERYKRQKPSGDTVTGKPLTKPAVVPIDTTVFVEHRRRTLNILPLCYLTLPVKNQQEQ